MKTTVALLLVLNISISLSLPLSSEDELKHTKKSQQTDSVPVELLLLVPPNLTQLRDDEEDIKTESVDSEDISLVEDIVNVMLRDTTIHEDDIQTVQEEEPLLLTEDLGALKPLLRKDRDVDFVLDEPLNTDIENSRDTLSLHDNNEDVKARLELEALPLNEDPLPREEGKDIEVIAKDSTTKNQPDDEGSFPPGRKPIEDLPSERSNYEEYADSAKPVEHVVATYPEMPGNAIPILLNCAPNVLEGHLTEAAPSYRNDASKARNNLEVENTLVTSDVDVKTNDFNDASNSDVLDLNSPASIIAMDRRRRHTLSDTGVTHYKVSEDYPETFKGNHHLVSADYPQPNMVRITT